MQQAILYARTIEQPNRNTEYNNHSCGKAISHSGKYEYKNGATVNCAYCNKQRWYHEWSFIENLKEPNKAIQCGRPNTKLCSHATYYGIAGYRNTCPIAGCSGDYTTPAVIKLSNFDFASLGINEHSKIYSISVNWNHRCRGVNVGNGRETKNSPPNFNGFNYYPNRTVVESYLSCGDEKLATLHGLKGVQVENPPNSDSMKGVGKAVAYNLDASKVTDPNFALYIQYGQNLSTNPGNLYISDICITIEYDNGEPVILSPSTDQELYTNTSSDCNCYSTITHEVDASWLYLNTPIGTVDTSSENLTVVFDANYCPEKVSVIDTTPNNTKNKIFKIEDHSGVTGDKCLHYYLKEYPEKRIEVWYKAKKYNIPKISVKNIYYKDVKNNEEWQLYDPDTSYITVKNGCSNKISIWFDSADKTEPDLHFDCLYPSESNLLMFDSDGNPSDIFQRAFYDKIQELNCGKHIIFIKNDSNPDELLSFVITIKACEFNFTISDSETGDWDQDRSDQGTKNILITRTDSINIDTVTIEVHDNTQNHPLNDNPEPIKTYQLQKNQTIEHQMFKYYAGTFNIKVVETTNTCDQKEFNQDFTINPVHKQYYDTLFTRGEDSTSFDYDYLVAWEADRVQYPIKAKEVELGATTNDIKICTEDSHIGLAETGLIPITVTNVGNRGTIKNLQIELNLLDENKRVSTDEWELVEGLFYKNRLIEDFYIYNDAIKNNISIKIDRNEINNSDAENVYIYIKELREDDTISFVLPFESRTPRTAYLTFLIFEEIQQIYWTGCNSPISDKSIKVSVLDSVATQLSITGNNDLLNPDLIDCPIECYSTKLNYQIKNIDSTDFNNLEGNGRPKTIIKNNVEMVPYEYKFKECDSSESPQSINWTNGVYEANENLKFYRKPFIKNINLPDQLIRTHIRFPNLKEEILYNRTDDQGDIIVSIPIPLSMQNKINVQELLTKYVYIEYQGNSVYDYSYLLINNSDYQSTANVLPAKTKIEYIGTKNKNYLNNQQIPVNTDITLKYRLSSNNILVNKESVQIFVKENDEYELNNIIVSSGQYNEFVHNKDIYDYERVDASTILNKYNDCIYIPDHTGECIEVIDGDTIKVNGIGNVRLVGINTPELGMLGANVSRYLVEKLCLNKTVGIKIDQNNPKDKYERTLGVVIIDNKNLNEILLKEGLAEIMYIPPSEFNPYDWGLNNKSYGANIEFTVKNPVAQKLTNLIDSIALVFTGNSTYAPYNKKNIIINKTKIPTAISYVDNLRSYQAGDIANIKISLKSIEETLENYIEFYPDISTMGSHDELCVSYKMCNLEEPKKFITEFKTDDERLVKNSVNKEIYCGYDTDVKVAYKLNTEVIQQTFINIINISITNGFKRNKEVRAEINLKQILESYTGDYEFISIETDDGDYALKDNQIITWLIGDMESYQKTNATIKIKANNIGLSNIKIKVFDYLHSVDENDEPLYPYIGQKQCEDCDD